jgi:hypothetical protein
MEPELSPGEIRAAAEVHRELGPEYSDAVVESFLERVDKRVAERLDREIAARLDARLQAAPRAEVTRPAHPNGRLMLFTGIAIGVFVTGVPSVMVASSGGGVLAKDETTVLVVIAVLLAVAAALAALRVTVRVTRSRGRSANASD